MPAELANTATLHNGVKIPWIGLGVFQMEDGHEVLDAVKTALKLGYRSLIRQRPTIMKKGSEKHEGVRNSKTGAFRYDEALEGSYGL